MTNNLKELFRVTVTLTFLLTSCGKPDPEPEIPVVEFKSTTSDGLESVAAAEIEVGISVASEAAVTVDFTISGSAVAAGKDHALEAGTLTFNAGEMSKTITIGGIVDDYFKEQDETVIITLSNPINSILGNSSTHTYTILNDDQGQCTLQSFVQTYTEPGVGYTSVLEQTFEQTTDTEGKVVSIRLTLDGELCSDVDDCVTIEGDSEYIISYTEGLPVKVDLFQYGEKNRGYKVKFSGDRISKEIYDFRGDIDEFRYVYDDQGLLVRVENFDNYSSSNQGEFELYSTREFVYSNGNVVKMIVSFVDERSGRTIPDGKRNSAAKWGKRPNRSNERAFAYYEVTYTYDDKKNPLKNDGLAALWTEPFISSNSNNILTEYEEIYDYTVANSYQYDENGYPISISIDYDGLDLPSGTTDEGTFSLNCQ